MTAVPANSLLERMRALQVTRLLARYPGRGVWAAFVFVNGFVTTALLSLVAMTTGTPFVFPSLGPTAILFFVTPASPTASPRNAVLGHGVGILCGYGALCLFGLQHQGPTTLVGVTLGRVFAAALSLAATGALMILARSAHPPAGATTLIISLGIITRPVHLVTIEVAVVLLAAQAILMNRVAGLDYPLWSNPSKPALDIPFRRSP